MESRIPSPRILRTFVGIQCVSSSPMSNKRCIMYNLTAWVRPLDHPKGFLVLSFIAWKLILFCIALTSPGPGYDTSTLLLHRDLNLVQAKSESGWELASPINSLVRWDAIYFTQLAKHGYLWEQEWAFGWGFTNLIAVTSRGEHYATLPALHNTDCY